jgi:hypothetical protein
MPILEIIKNRRSIRKFEKLKKIENRDRVFSKVVLEEKRREIIKEWINSGRIDDINNKR